MLNLALFIFTQSGVHLVCSGVLCITATSAAVAVSAKVMSVLSISLMHQ